MNPNNCKTCDYKQLIDSREKGHCYMFRDMPTDVCMAHTGRHPTTLVEQILRAQQIIRAVPNT